MAAPAGHHLPSGEIVAIDGRHHLDHLARPHLLRCIGCPIHFHRAGAGMTIRAVKSQRRAHDPHRPHEVVNGNPLQYLNVLEHLVRCSAWRRLLRRKRAAEQPYRSKRGNRDEHFPEVPVSCHQSPSNCGAANPGCSRLSGGALVTRAGPRSRPTGRSVPGHRRYYLPNALFLRLRFYFQNVNLSAICTSRGGAAFTTWPNRSLSMSPFTATGPKNCAWLKVLNVSRRNCSVFVSVNLKDRQQREIEIEHARSVEGAARGGARSAQSVRAEQRRIEIRQPIARIAVQVQRPAV